MKPLGISLTVGATGPRLGCSRPSRTEDLLWDAVEQAQIEGWTPKRLIAEMREAWEYQRKLDIEGELKEFDK